MASKTPQTTLEQVGEVIRGVDLARLENRLAGKPLIEMEHCLIEVLGYLSEDHRSFNRFTAEHARDCIEARSKDEFVSVHAEYREEKSRFGTDHNLASPIGFYFRALLDRLTVIEDKQDVSGKNVTVRNARMLTALIVREIEMMWASSQYTNKKVEHLWNHWMFEKG